jgi:large subunit ribosomal protein L28
MASGQCDICGKTTVFGRNIRHRHSGRWERKAPMTSRTFRPNIHKQVVLVGGEVKRLNVCTRCLRTSTKVAV